MQNAAIESTRSNVYRETAIIADVFDMLSFRSDSCGFVWSLLFSCLQFSLVLEVNSLDMADQPGTQQFISFSTEHAITVMSTYQ